MGDICVAFVAWVGFECKLCTVRRTLAGVGDGRGRSISQGLTALPGKLMGVTRHEIARKMMNRTSRPGQQPGLLGHLGDLSINLKQDGDI